MSRLRRSASNALAASGFGLLAMLLGSSAGCEFLTRTDRSEIPEGAGGAGTGGAGGSGGSCTIPATCPGTDTVCRTRTCTAGMCGFSNAPAGTATDTQTAADCLREVCDGQGAVTTEPDDTDILDDKKDCTTDLCDTGKPQNMPLKAGASCKSDGGIVCDGAGSCVECVGPSDCTSFVCTANKCVSPGCIDMVKNGTETDVDCGGADCAGCADGKLCGAPGDCASKICELKVCQVPTCSDTIENGTETDVDCGGSCSPCAPGLGCMQNSDCIGGACSGSVCLESCTDKLKNGNETDVDCGGPTCGPCADAKTCSVDTDCASNICNNGSCQASSCTDMVKNSDETGVDCGGTTCLPCADGLGCKVTTDCTSGVCTGMVCLAPTCSDMVKNGLETDVDCGGGVCLGCDLSKACGQNSDCTSNICVTGVCVDALCGDGLVTGAETCDDGNATGSDGCSSMCAPEVGYTCMGTMPTVCTPICNDSMVVPGEPCDDGNATNGDGCSATCAIELGYACAGSPSVCASKCGDGVVLLAETCDDGNNFGGDGCSTVCTVESGFNCAGSPSTCTAICGDGQLVGFEECDDSNTNAGDGCNATCNVESNYGCTGVPSVCYPIEIEPNNACVNASGPFQPPFILNGRILQSGDQDYIKITVPAYADLKLEVFAPDLAQCVTGVDSEIDLYKPDCSTLLITDDDDGVNACSLINSTVDAAVRNLAPGDYYALVYSYNHGTGTIPSYKLQVTYNALCGNSMIQGSETCDDGNLIAGDGCDPNCRVTGCGNGYKGGTEQCDDGNTTSGDGCDSNCTPTGCGNGVMTGSETCDDGNTNNNDGCSSTCAVQAGWTCTGTPSVCTFNCGNGIKTGTEQCDDGNVNSGDGCSNLCSIEPGYICNGTPSMCIFTCGNGLIDGTDQCDDANLNSGDGCSNVCTTEPGYLCTGAPSMCVFTCGNGVVNGNDQCDDGNTVSGDGCSAGCLIELDHQCSGTPSVCPFVEQSCNDGIDNDGDGVMDAMDTDCQIPAYFPACAAGQMLRIFRSVDIPKAIPDSPNTTGITSDLYVGVGPTPATIVRAAMLYNITHTYDADLDLTLIRPNGVNLDICSDNGGGSANFMNTVLDSTCATSVVSGVAPFSACYQPEATFATFAGTPASGLWKFKAVDDAGGDTGTINSWAMILCVTP